MFLAPGLVKIAEKEHFKAVSALTLPDLAVKLDVHPCVVQEKERERERERER